MSLLLVLLFSLLPSARAWGSLGHETVAYLAQNYVSEHTRSWAQAILNDTTTSYLANVATWADSYRYTDEGAFSAPYHFIDALDDPPKSCNVDYERDCTSGGCIVSALANYTQRVQQQASLSATEVNHALRWIIHFTGDITQPLHDESYELGGNDIDVTFDGTSTNLHHIWDTNMPEQLRGGYSLSDAEAWAADLVEQINSGAYADQKASWIADLNVDDAVNTTLRWAQDANAFVCSVVAPDGWESVRGEEAYPDYYNGTIGTIELQIAKGGYRLAKWLDAIAENQDVTERAVSDLSEEDLLPRREIELTAAQRRRAAVGYGCGCGHEHEH